MRIEAGADDTTQRRHDAATTRRDDDATTMTTAMTRRRRGDDATTTTTTTRTTTTTTRRRRRRSDEDDDAATTTTRRGRRRGDDTAGRRGDDTECCHRNVATEMMPPKCPQRRGKAGTTTASLPLPRCPHSRCSPQMPCSPPASLQCPGPSQSLQPRPRRSDPGSDSLPSVTGFRWRCWGLGGEDSGGDG